MPLDEINNIKYAMHSQVKRDRLSGNGIKPNKIKNLRKWALSARPHYTPTPQKRKGTAGRPQTLEYI